MARGDEPDFDQIKRLLADVARLVGVEEEDVPARAIGWMARPDEIAGDRPKPDARLECALIWARARDDRDRIFGADLFFDPSWNILLDLYISERKGAEVSITSMCVASKAPATTALRWLTMLEKRGLVGRRADAYDRRRSLLFLTEDGRRKIEETLDRTAESGDKLRPEAIGRLN